MMGRLAQIALAIMLGAVIFVAGVMVGGRPVESGIARLPDSVKSKLIGETEGGLTGEVLRILEDDFFREIDPEELDVQSVDALVESLADPFTDYLTEEEYAALKDRNAGRYIGVGITVSPEDKRLTIVSVAEGGPAAEGGLKPGDQIVKVDGIAVDPDRLDEAVDRIRGPEGTTVMLTIRRGKRAPREFTLTRAPIAIELTEGRVELSGSTKVGYVRLRQFSRGAGGAVRDEVNALVEQEVDALVLDLRGNPGGLVNEAVEVSGVFLPEGSEVVTTEGRAVEEKTLKTDDRPATAVEIPLVVLVDANSASASEIVAGALRDDKRASLVGHRTFGKALVQGTRPLRDGGALKLTIARYRTPSGQDINKKGLVPGVTEVDDPETPEVDEALRRAVKVVAAKAE